MGMSFAYASRARSQPAWIVGAVELAPQPQPHSTAVLDAAYTVIEV